LYLSDGVILLDRSLDRPENRRLHRVVLAEELGHYYTVPQSNALRFLGYSAFSDNEEIQIDRDEFRAVKWATSFLMPNHRLDQAITDGCRSVYDLAEWFDVTEKFVKSKLAVMRMKRELGFKRAKATLKEGVLKWHAEKNSLKE